MVVGAKDFNLRGLSRRGADRILQALAEVLFPGSPRDACERNYPLSSDEARNELVSRGLAVSTTDAQSYAKRHCKLTGNGWIWWKHDVDGLGSELVAAGRFNQASIALAAAGFDEETIVQKVVDEIKADAQSVLADGKEAVLNKLTAQTRN